MKVAVVLGGAHLPQRLDGAIKLYKDGIIDLIVYTGVSQGKKAEEYLRGNGVKKYLIEPNATSTVENACILKKMSQRARAKPIVYMLCYRKSRQSSILPPTCCL